MFWLSARQKRRFQRAPGSGDISILGFDGIELSEYYQPALDTMFQPASEMALSSINLLFDMIQGGKARHIVYKAMLLKGLLHGIAGGKQ